VEAGLELDEDADDGEGADGSQARPKKRRRGGEMDGDWKCEVEGCGKDFKSVRPCYSYRLARRN
jgi:general transcription factor IIIA